MGLMNDDDGIALAIDEARLALAHDDVPIGAVVVSDDTVIARAHNEREKTNDPTAHAELLALKAASEVTGSWQLTDCTLYVTLEPCAMCAGALVNARIARLVYGADDPKAGAVRSLFTLTDDARLNHQVEVASGVRSEECGQLLTSFFVNRR